MSIQVNIPIFYFSGTGNTWWVAKTMAEALTDGHCTAQSISMEQVTTNEVKALVAAASIIGIGYPIYASDAPLIAQSFIDQLPDVETPTPVLVFATQMGWSGNGAYFLHRKLEQKGYKVCWAVEFRMPNNIGMHVFPVPSSPDFDKFVPVLEHTRRRIEKLSQRVKQDQPWIQGKNILNAGLSWIQRGPWRLTMKWTQTHTWSVNTDACTHCGRCERICPVENIHLNDERLPIWGDQCNMCIRCFNYCPEQAILVYKKGFDQKRNGIHPFRGPVPEFKPELITRKHRNEIR